MNAIPQKTVRLDHDTKELARHYDANSDAQFNHGKKLIALLDIKPGEQVLDIGAGTGRLAAFVADLVGSQGHVTAIDPLPLRVGLAKAKGKTNLATAVGRAEDLSAFADNSFDVVYLNSVFHWVTEKPKALAEIFRVLKPGGRLGLNTQDPDHPHESQIFVNHARASTGVRIAPSAAVPAVGISARHLQDLSIEAGFVDYAAELKTLVDFVAGAGELLAWSTSSSFGNFLAGTSDEDREKLTKTLSVLLEPRRSEEGIRLKRYLVFATARKP